MKIYFRTTASLVVLLFSFLLAAGQTVPKKIYLAPDDHTDYMWTANEATYRQTFLDTIDYYLAQADATSGNIPIHRSRWNMDGSFWLWEYERNKPDADFQRVIGRLRDGHFSMPLTPLVQVSGGTPAEAVLRGMYYPGRIERRFNLRFPMAVAMENQTFPFGLASLWAGAGAKYSWRGVCGCVTKVPNAGDREHEIYYCGGADGSKVLMKWNSLFPRFGSQTDPNEGIGGYAEARYPLEVTEFVDNDAGFRSRYPYPIIGAFGQGWDDLKTTNLNILQAAQAKTTPDRQVIVSNEQDFFEDFEANHGNQLPTVAASFGNEWELYQASMAEVSARVKRATEKLRNAEILATLVSLKNPGFMNNRIAARDTAFMNLGLYSEHDWTGDGPVPRSERAAWQRRVEGGVTDYVNTLHTDAATALGGLITKNGTNRRFYVFNSLSQTRSDYADFPFSDTNPVYVVEVSTNQEVPSQIVTVDGQRRLRVLAQNVPSVGYKVYEIRSGTGTNFGNAATRSGGVIENSFYRITVASRGAITSLIDKTRGNRQFVRTVNGRVINDLGAGSGTLSVENVGAVSVTLKAVSSAPLAHTTRITLVRNSDRIEIRNDITQNFSDVRTWSFAFNLDSPDVRHEEVGAVIRAKLLADGGNYSPRNARYDWLTLNHFADVSGTGDVGVTLSNADTYFMKLGNSTVETLDTNTPQISPLVGGQVDGANYGILNQDGDTQFLQRFALQTHGIFDQTTAMRFALEHQNLLVTGEVTGDGGSPYPADAFSLLTISNPKVLLWALKPSEEGIEQGVIARVWNQSGAAENFTLDFVPTLTSAKRTTHIETNLADATVNNGTLAANAERQQLQTFRLLTGSTPSPNQPPSVSLTSPANNATFTAPATINLSAAASDSDGAIAKVEFFAGSTKLGESLGAPYDFVWNNVAVGNYALTAVATDNLGATTVSTAVNITVNGAGGGTLPVGWTAQDVGSVGVNGTAAFGNNTFTIEGGGGDIWNNSDDFRFVYQTLNGDGQIIARVVSVENTNGWAKAGVMMRQSLNPNSTNAAIVLSPNDGPGFQRRLSDGATTVEDCCGGNFPPYWLRLVRQGNNVAAYKSADGSNWVLINSDTVAMSGTIYVGLAVSANSPGQLSTGVFDNVTISSTAVPTPTPTPIITPTPTPTPSLNILSNGGFENGQSPWNAYNASIASNNARSGTFAATITGTVGGVWQNVTSLQPATTYTLSGYLKASDVNNGAYLYVKNNGVETDSPVIVSPNYEQTSVNFTTGANTSVEIGVWKSSGNGNAYVDDLTLELSGNPTPTPTPTPTPVAEQSMFTTQTPVLQDATDNRTYELGMKFQSSVGGTITAIRYWKSPSETGTHTGRIWSSAGVQLVSVDFAAETASGWQRADLTAPLAVSADTVYVVTVNINGRYPFTAGGLASSVVNGNLSTIVGNNAVYGDAGAFPTNSFQNSNYFRDVYFVPTGVASVKAVPLYRKENERLAKFTDRNFKKDALEIFDLWQMPPIFFF